MLRRLHDEQPETFKFSKANEAWALAQVQKYPEGRAASAIIPLLWRAQEQEGWLSRPAIEHVAQRLGLAYIRALEVATFYFMFQLQPVGSLAHVQVCGTTSCMICGAEDLISVCREKIAPDAHQISADGKFSWEEVECLGACTNAPMVQIGKDFYEDLTTERFAEILEEFSRGEVPTPGPQNGRFSCEPKGGATALTDFVMPQIEHNGSVARAVGIGDTVARIQGDETVYSHPKLTSKRSAATGKAKVAKPAAKTKSAAKPASKSAKAEATTATPQNTGTKPKMLKAPRKGGADDLKLISGIGPKLEKLCNSLGIFYFAQIAEWGADEIAWIDSNLDGFRGRASRDNWVDQARRLRVDG